MRFSAPLYLFDQKDCSLKVVPLGSDRYFIPAPYFPYITRLPWEIYKVGVRWAQRML
jgi:hypothetical protein